MSISAIKDDMNPLIEEYRSLPVSSDHLPDTGPNARKCEILRSLDAHVNEPEVAQLLLELLRDPLEYDLARVEAIKLVGLYVSKTNPLCDALWVELEQLSASDEDEMLQGWAERYIEFRNKA